MVRILFALTLLVALVSTSSAAIIVVPDDQPTLAAALAVASGQTKDEILLMPGTYNESRLLVNVNQGGISIRSSTGNAADVIVDAQGDTLLFVVDAPLEFNGITMQGCLGPGVRQNLAGFTVTVTNCVIRNNGLGGLQVDQVNASGTEFRDNSGGNFAGVGGAITVFGSATLSDCRFFDNQSQNGGAINSTGNLQVSSSHFEGNSATNGGAVYSEDGDYHFSNTRFIDNEALQDGGALFARGGTDAFIVLGFSDCTLQGNTAAAGGGAVMLLETDDSARGVGFNRTVFSLNTAGFGGGLAASSSTVSIGSCTFSGNAAGTGSAVHQAGSTATISRSIIVSGTGAGAGVDCDGGATVTVACSDVFNNSGGDWVGCLADQGGADGNLSVDPQFCSADPDGDSYWFLQTDSPCADLNSACGSMGAQETASGCDDTPVEPVSWGGLKRGFRN